jgi:hypothetical protein
VRAQVGVAPSGVDLVVEEAPGGTGLRHHRLLTGRTDANTTVSGDSNRPDAWICFSIQRRAYDLNAGLTGTTRRQAVTAA